MQFPKLLDTGPLEDELPVPEIRVDTPQKLASAKDALIDKAVSNGFDQDYADELCEIVEGYAAIFRITHSSNPAQIEPFRVRIDPGAETTVGTSRK